MTAPLVFLGAIGLAFIALIVMVRTGGVADGPRIQATLQTLCPADAMPVLTGRMNAIGLGTPTATEQASSVVLTANLPSNEVDHETIPRMLARAGLLQLRGKNGDILGDNQNVTGAGVELDNAGMPTTLVELDLQARDALSGAVESNGPVTAHFDGELVATFSRLPDLEDGYLELPSGQGATAIRMRVATDRSILLGSGPLPCKTDVVEVVATSPAG